VDINQQKEQFSNAYIQALASAAGYSLYKPFVDNDSVDWGIAARGTEGVVRALLLELQLKSTSSNFVDDTPIRYRLKLKNYNDLILDGYSSPRILVVVIIPDNPTDWLQQSQPGAMFKTVWVLDISTRNGANNKYYKNYCNNT
jgi:Domain of unknown function (DUF4365)